MRRLLPARGRRWRLAGVLATAIVSIAAGPLRPPPPPPPGLRPPVARAWIVVDVETGAVVDADNEHGRLRPASTIKVLTALIAVRVLAPDAAVPVTATAAGMPPERIGMVPGQSWSLPDVLHALLMVSANDAAVALAEAVSGSRSGFAAEMARVAASLGVVDRPVLNDPAGLDDASSFRGGDEISAYDLAVLTRAALAVSAIQDIVSDRRPYAFTGPDGAHHVLHNQNRLLRSDSSSVGVKPGYTRAADETLIAAATRGGRTMMSVELGSPPAQMYPTAAALLARGFAVAPGDQGRLGYLPAVRDPLPGSAGKAPAAAQLPRLHSRAVSRAAPSRVLGLVAGVSAAGALVALAIRRRNRHGAWSRR